MIVKALKKIFKNFKDPYLRVRNTLRPDIVRVPPFVKANVTLGGIKLSLLTHQEDKIHGGMVRGDNSRDYLTHGELRHLVSKLEPNIKILDIGANLGTVSIMLAKHQPSAKIYSFEPEPTNFGMLLLNMQINDVKNIIPYNFAVGTNESFINMYLNSTNFGDHRSFIPTQELESGQMFDRQKIPILKVNPLRVLNDSLGGDAPNYFDLIKIDTQGADFDVLSAVLPLCKKGTVVVIEFSPFHLAEFGETWESIKGSLDKFSRLQSVNPENETSFTTDMSIDDINEYFLGGKDSYRGYIDLSLIY